jgi:hypothetical protein
MGGYDSLEQSELQVEVDLASLGIFSTAVAAMFSKLGTTRKSHPFRDTQWPIHSQNKTKWDLRLVRGDGTHWLWMPKETANFTLSSSLPGFLPRPAVSPPLLFPLSLSVTFPGFLYVKVCPCYSVFACVGGGRRVMNHIHSLCCYAADAQGDNCKCVVGHILSVFSDKPTSKQAMRRGGEAA